MILIGHRRSVVNVDSEGADSRAMRRATRGACGGKRVRACQWGEGVGVEIVRVVREGVRERRGGKGFGWGGEDGGCGWWVVAEVEVEVGVVEEMVMVRCVQCWPIDCSAVMLAGVVVRLLFG